MYYRYKNNNNKDDISYSFSLESYIDSLNNDYSFNDYKIKVNNKTYDELSIEHNRLHNEINKLINEDMFSTEGILDNIVNKIKDFGKWLIEFIKKIIHALEVLLKRIISKIYEITTRSKNDLYKKFEKAIFTSLDFKIKDRKLNPNLIIDCIKFMSELSTDINQFQSNSIPKSLDTQLSFIEQLERDRENNKFLDYLFYIDKEKKEMDIKEWFGCKENERPPQIQILSDSFLKVLKENKKNTSESIKELKKYLDKLIKEKDTFLYHDSSNNTEDVMEKLKAIRNKILILYNANYTFFIKSLDVRNKVSKYILKASLGKVFDTLKYQKMDEGTMDIFGKNAIFHQYKKPYYIPCTDNYEFEEAFQKLQELSSASLAISAKGLKSKNNRFLTFLLEHSNTNNRYQIFIFIDHYYSDKEIYEYKNENENAMKKFKYYKKLYDENKIFILLNELRNFFLESFNVFLPSLKFATISSGGFLKNYHNCISIKIFLPIGKYTLGRSDTIYHTSDVSSNLETIKFHFGGERYKHIQYTEGRIYGGLNKILSRNGLTGTNLKSILNQLKKLQEENKNNKNEFEKITDDMIKKFTIYRLDVKEGTIVYTDPEYATSDLNLDYGSIIIPTDVPIRCFNLNNLIEELHFIY